MAQTVLLNYHFSLKETKDSRRNADSRPDVGNITMRKRRMKYLNIQTPRALIRQLGSYQKHSEANWKRLPLVNHGAIWASLSFKNCNYLKPIKKGLTVTNALFENWVNKEKHQVYISCLSNRSYTIG